MDEIHIWWELSSDKGKGMKQPVEKTGSGNGRKPRTPWLRSDAEKLLSTLTLAVEQGTSVRVLKKFLSLFEQNVREELAHQNTQLPTPILVALTTDHSVLVREVAASRENLPEKVATIFAHDKNYEVQACLARNPNTSAKLLNLMFVNSSRRHNPDVWEKMSESRTHLYVEIARNPKTPTNIRARFLSCSNVDLLQAVLTNPSTTEAELSSSWREIQHLSREGNYFAAH